MSYLSGATSTSNPLTARALAVFKHKPKPKPKPAPVKPLKPPVVAVGPAMPVLLAPPKPQALPPITAETPAQSSPVAPSATSSGGGGGGGGASGGFVPGDAMADVAPIAATVSDSTGFSVSPLVLGVGAVALYFILSRRR